MPGATRPDARSLPRLWLFSDQRMADEQLFAALWRLPRGSGVVFRHYRLAADRRLALLKRVRAIALRRGLVLLLSDPPAGVRADGVHRAAGRRGRTAAGLVSASAHDAPSLRRAFALGADIVFVSPLFPTRSHPGGRVLGPLRFGLMRRGAAGPVVALGGMDARRGRRLRALGAHGYAGIDCFAERNGTAKSGKA